MNSLVLIGTGLSKEKRQSFCGYSTEYAVTDSRRLCGPGKFAYYFNYTVCTNITLSIINRTDDRERALMPSATARTRATSTVGPKSSRACRKGSELGQFDLPIAGRKLPTIIYDSRQLHPHFSAALNFSSSLRVKQLPGVQQTSSRNSP